MVRMLRPDFFLLMENARGAFVGCSCGETLQNQRQIREHWQAGHFDVVHDEDRAGKPTPPPSCHHCDEPMPNGRCWWCGGPNRNREEDTDAR